MYAISPTCLRRAALAAAALAVSACSQKLEGPTLRIDSVDPPLGCNTRPTTVLTLKGAGFSPVVLGTLGGTAQLAFPRVEIQQITDATGMKVAVPAIRVPDDPAHSELSHLHWKSDSQLDVDVTSDFKLPPGSYAVTVTSPATPDVQKVTFDKAFMLVGGPTVKSVAPAASCDAQINQVITLQGTGFLSIGAQKPTITVTATADMKVHTYPPMLFGCSDVPGDVMTGLQTCDQITFTLRPGDLPEGDYTVTVTNPSPADCASAAGKFKITPPPSITKVLPATICADGGVIDVKGANIVKGAVVKLGGQSSIKPSMFVSTGEIKGDFTGVAYMPGMSYDVGVENPDGCTATLPNAVMAVSGPSFFFIDADVAINTIATPLTLYATQLAAGAVMVTLTKKGAMNGVDAKAMIDPAHPMRVLATVPKGLPAGSYDVAVSDANGCPTTLPGALAIFDKPMLRITSVSPSSGWAQRATTITINAQSGLSATPRVYLAPKSGAAAIELRSVTFLSMTQLQAVVPPGLDTAPAANPYDVVVVNTDGTAGSLSAAFTATAMPPPRIDAVLPAAVPSTNTSDIVIRGGDFRMPTVSFLCNDMNMTMIPPAATKTGGTISITIAAPPLGMLPPGTLCTVRVTNGDDKVSADFVGLGITSVSGEPVASKVALVAPDLVTARRAPGVASAPAGTAGRFVYAAGGDDGKTANAFDTVESLAASGSGTTGVWMLQRNKLNAKRTLAGFVAIGRYLYAVGGNDGTTAVATVERAMVLDPQKAPVVTDVDLKPLMATGVGAGTFIYRVSATFDPNDPDNPGGESLPSAPVVVRLPAIMNGGARVTLTIANVPGATGFRIYRTPMPNLAPGKEQFLAGSNGNTFTDDATMMPSGAGPLPLGSTGTWRMLASLSTPRESPAVAFASDAMSPQLVHLYALGGRSLMGAALGTYEYLDITVDPGSGQETPAKSWTPGMNPFGAPRFRAGAFVLSNDVDADIPAGTSYLYVGGGTANLMQPVGSVQMAKLPAMGGGELGMFTPANNVFLNAYGFAPIVAGAQLLAIGGQPQAQAVRLAIADNMGALTGFTAAALMLQAPRDLPGAALVGPLVYVVGGDAGMNTATKSTEWMVQ